MNVGILNSHPAVSHFLRAHLINWLVNVCEVLKKEDATLPFVAVNMMDRFYKLTKDP
jgi:TorA maturation chaperone TorD